MKTIGIIGGMSWQSTITYYRLINESVAQRMGGLHSAQILLRSLDFAPIEQAQHAEDWSQCAEYLIDAAQDLQNGGADFAIIATNTMHQCFDAVSRNIDLELIHIADPTGAYCTKNNLRRVGLLGTAFTMQQPFYRERLQRQYQLDVLVPTPAEQAFVHKVIYEELCLGAILESSKQQYLNIIENLRKLGAEAVILGCTEIGLLVRQSDVDVPLVDTTAMHAEAAVCRALTEIQGRG